MVLPRWYLYSRKHQGDKGSASRQEGQKPIQIWARVHLAVPSEPHKPLSNQYFQIFVIYLEDVQQDSPSFTSKDQG